MEVKTGDILCHKDDEINLFEVTGWYGYNGHFTAKNITTRQEYLFNSAGDALAIKDTKSRPNFAVRCSPQYEAAIVYKDKSPPAAWEDPKKMCITSWSSPEWRILLRRKNDNATLRILTVAEFEIWLEHL